MYSLLYNVTLIYYLRVSETQTLIPYLYLTCRLPLFIWRVEIARCEMSGWHTVYLSVQCWVHTICNHGCNMLFILLSKMEMWFLIFIQTWVFHCHSDIDLWHTLYQPRVQRFNLAVCETSVRCCSEKVSIVRENLPRCWSVCVFYFFFKYATI